MSKQTKKDFEEIAKILKRGVVNNDIKGIVDEMTTFCADRNEHFDESRFKKACGVE